MIVGALSSDLARALIRSLPEDLAGAVELLGVHGCDWWTSVPAGALVILDPAVLDSDGVSLAMAATALSAAGARVVFYTTFSSESMRAVAFAAALHPVELWITGIDDRAAEFGRRVQRLSAHRFVDELLPKLL